MERPNAWKDYTPEQLDELHYLCEGYKAFISDNKTERECCAAAVTMAEEAGYVNLAGRIEAGEPLRPGDKVYAVNRGKSLMLLHLGTAPLERGVNILGAHIDSPRLDVKQTPSRRRTRSSRWTRTTTAASRSTSGSRSRWPSTASWPRRTAAS